MTINYKLNENDFLTYQLFIASQSKRIQKKRKRSKVLIPMVYSAIALLFYFQNSYSMSIFFLIISVLWFFVYPLWEKQHYLKHYQGFIQENYKDRCGRTVTLELTNDFILAQDNGSESKVLTTELQEICEIPTAIYIKLNGGQAFILPKNEFTNLNDLKTQLNELATHLNIGYVTNHKWKWS